MTPQGFNWQTTKTIAVDIGVTGAYINGPLCKISIYIIDPSLGQAPIANGATGYLFRFSGPVEIPSYIPGLWLKISYPDNATSVTYQPLTGSSLKYTFQREVKQVEMKDIMTGPDCKANCDQIISENDTVTIKDGLTFCVTESFGGLINFEPSKGGGTLKVCGNAYPQEVNNMGTNCYIVVTDGGILSINTLFVKGFGTITAWRTATVAINHLSLTEYSSKLINYSQNFQINNDFHPYGKVENYGILTFNGDYTGSNKGGYLHNFGTMNVLGHMEMMTNLMNSGNLLVSGDLSFPSNCDYSNSCMIMVSGKFYISIGSFTMDHGYLKVYGWSAIGQESNLVMMNQSMLSSSSIELKNNIKGKGSRNTILTTDQVEIKFSSKVSGPIEWVDNDGILNTGYTSQFINGASFVTLQNANNYVPVCGCNPDGFGSPPVGDTDGDRVPDADDDFPTDAMRAFNNYYPSSSTFASFAFEDLWPAYGDFDMNDLVVDVRFNKVTNSQNKVVEIINQYKVKAVGGNFQYGFAFQLDQLDPGVIREVTGTVLSTGSYINIGSNGLENGTEKPVVIICDDVEKVIHRVGGSYFNTEKNGPKGNSDLVTIRVHFLTPQQISDLGSIPYNHFLIINKKRNHEIHLPGKRPTSKADISLFGTENDDTKPESGKYYKSKTNLPWAIFVPEEFDYPSERNDIVTAHLKFADWAQSVGIQYLDWHTNLSGYRNPANIY